MILNNRNKSEGDRRLVVTMPVCWWISTSFILDFLLTSSQNEQRKYKSECKIDTRFLTSGLWRRVAW